MKLTKNQAKQIRALKRMKDEDIDFSDIPERADWSSRRREVLPADQEGRDRPEKYR